MKIEKFIAVLPRARAIGKPGQARRERSHTAPKRATVMGITSLRVSVVFIARLGAMPVGSKQPDCLARAIRLALR
jgi:hypothetical protein